MIVLLIVNSFAALGSLYFVPLAMHIYSCGVGPKWCHLQAFILGLPSAAVLTVLIVVTLAMTIANTASCARSSTIACWLALAVPLASLGALFISVAHNSK